MKNVKIYIINCLEMDCFGWGKKNYDKVVSAKRSVIQGRNLRLTEKKWSGKFEDL